MNRLQQFILKSGTSVSVTLITFISIVTSMVVTYLTVAYGFTTLRSEMIVALIISAIVPAIVAPIISYMFVSLLFKVDALEKETRILAQYDVLTGLLSRRAFYEQVEQQLRKAFRERQKLAILVADVDEFKSINDTFGHQAGDKALRFIASVINHTIRSNDIVGRTGGDEFVFCLPSVSTEHALEFGQRLINNLNSAVYVYDNSPINLNLSVGAYGCEIAHDTEVDDIVKAADAALYRAKNSGKNQIAQ